MEAVIGILEAVFWVAIALSILVFIHELGHYWAAKLFGMRVEQFSIGFPPKIFGKQIGETEYRIGAVPLGGYVKISGMIDESMDSDYAESEPQPWEFRSKPVWQRIIVITAGVVFNLVLAVMIFIGLKWGYGDQYIPAENVPGVYVADGSLAYDIGLRTDDRIVAVNGAPLERFDDLFAVQTLSADQMTVTVERDGTQQTFDAPEDIITQLRRSGNSFGLSPVPALIGGVDEGFGAAKAGIEEGARITAVNDQPVRYWSELIERVEAAGADTVRVAWQTEEGVAQTGVIVPVRDDIEVADSTITRYRIGVRAPTESQLAAFYGIRQVDYSFGEAVVEGTAAAWTNTAATIQGFKKIFTGREDVRESLGGPVQIARITRDAAQQGGQSFWFIVAMLSITLAIVNILPIPALDGGHLVFLIYEGITRREPSVKVRMALQQVGMILLLALMAFVIFNDFTKL